MDEQMIALGRRVVACKGWRLMRGMVGTAPNERSTDRYYCTVLWNPPGKINGLHIAWAGCGPEHAVINEDDFLPDLTDPATLGCLLALVREALGDPTARTSYVTGTYPHRWVVLRHGLLGWKTKAHGDTEPEALVAALEAAP